MITPSFSLTATERVLPRLALDFTTASLDPRVTFTRTGNTATVVNSSGFVASINANLPRFDYDPVTLACKGLLIEEARTNSFTYSNDLTNVIWTPTNASVTVDSTISPDGTANANRINENAANSTHTVTSATFSFVSGVSYSISVYAKAGQRSAFAIRRSGAGGASAQFDLITQTAANLVGTSAVSITPAGNGWFRCVMSWAAGATASRTHSIDLQNPYGTSTYQGVSGEGMYFYGMQLETGSFATSYIPTVASTVTRNADVATMTGANFSDWYTATTGAAVVWAIPQTATGTRPLIQFDDTTALEIITLRGNVANPELYIVDILAQAQIDAGTIVANTAYKLSGAWNTNSCATAQNGAAAVTDNTATIPTPTQLRIGSDGTNYASAIIQKVLYYPQRIIDAEVQAISK